jgi:putative acetyltransferase
MALGTTDSRPPFLIRAIRHDDDEAIATIIRSVMTAFGACGPGYSIEDAAVSAMTEAYRCARSGYFVVEWAGAVVGGAGFVPLAGADPFVCELRKMYLLASARGLGAGRALLDACIDGARQAGFGNMYLETLSSMHAAERLYVRAGFMQIDSPLVAMGHFGCNRFYVRSLA